MTSLERIKAEDVMQTEVVTFAPSTSIEDALRTFEELHISGAPVVDDYGRIVGMLSAFDVARPEHLKGGRIDAEGGAAAMVGSDDADEAGMRDEDVVLSMEDYGPATRDRPTVSDWMSTDVKCAGPEWSLPRVCRLMVEEHVHRVPVVHEKRLKGIVSSLDVVNCVAGGARLGSRTAHRGSSGRYDRPRHRL
jgi:CBS domain-containing protein